MGIFLMNIIGMGFPIEAYINPNAYSPQQFGIDSHGWLSNEGINYFVFSIMNIFVDQKMMGLFSLLFGASTLLFLSKLQDKNLSVGYYFKRNAWLFFFGVLHAVFLYIGDVLLVYGLCAFFLYVFAKVGAKWQFSFGVFVYSFSIIQQVLMQQSLTNFSDTQLNELWNIWSPSHAYIEETIEFVRTANMFDWASSALGLLSGDSYSYGKIYDWYWGALELEVFVRAFGMMLIGMALFKWGVLPNTLSKDKRTNVLTIGFYLRLFLICFVCGVAIASYGFFLNSQNNWAVEHSAIGGRILNHVATPFISVSYVAMCVLFSRMTTKGTSIIAFKIRLQAVGRMAFTNYIMHSLIGLITFTGVGFALFGKLTRVELLIFVMSVFAFQLWFSHLWLKRHQYGPLEWVWRKLTFFELKL